MRALCAEYPDPHVYSIDDMKPDHLMSIVGVEQVGAKVYMKSCV